MDKTVEQLQRENDELKRTIRMMQAAGYAASDFDISDDPWLNRVEIALIVGTRRYELPVDMMNKLYTFIQDYTKNVNPDHMALRLNFPIGDDDSQFYDDDGLSESDLMDAIDDLVIELDNSDMSEFEAILTSSDLYNGESDLEKDYIKVKKFK